MDNFSKQLQSMFARFCKMERVIPVPHLPAEPLTNTAAIGAVLYTKYVYFFELAGAVLLVAMIGTIVLTLRHRAGAKRQDVAVQVGRRREDAIEVIKVQTGKGIS